LRVTATTLAPWVAMAAAAVRRRYPVALVLTLEDPADLGLPSELTPVFSGSYDWHSAVHGHWSLARAARLHPQEAWAAPARDWLEASFTPEKLARERAFLSRRPGFEQPYGISWLLQLAAELRAWDDPAARRWVEALAPLESLAAERLVAWGERLPFPVRSGEHGQSAFALGLALDWARDTGRAPERDRLCAAALRLYRADSAAPVEYEPSAHDFLSPALGEADLMRRVLAREAYTNWVYGFLPDAREERLTRWLEPVSTPDRSDGKLAHLDGLNLSRAWMLRGIVGALPVGHELYSPLERAAARHAEAGLAGAAGEDWMGTHWLASFALYLLTGRGLEGGGSGTSSDT
jgi:hypothetical protein